MSEMIEIKTPLIVEARCVDLVAFKKVALETFAERVVQLYQDLTKEDDKKDQNDMYTLNFYGTFTNANTKNISACQIIKVNESNIIFEMTIHAKDLLKQDIENRIQKLSKNKEISKDNSIYKITSIPDWQQLFGQGEFPFIIIRVFKLGGVEYYTYSITR